MAVDSPKYLRLPERLSGRTLVDVNSGWSISGLDVKEAPDPKKYPNAARFVREKLNRGALEPASKAEFEEVQEAFKQSRKKFNDKLEDMQRLGVPVGQNFAFHQEANLQSDARERREKLQQERQGRSEEQEQEEPASSEGEDDEDDEKKSSKKSAKKTAKKSSDKS